MNENKNIYSKRDSIADSLNNLENENVLRLIKNKLLFLKDDLKESRDYTKQTLNDSIYEQKFERGETKYSTLNRLRTGSPTSRVNQFDCL